MKLKILVLSLLLLSLTIEVQGQTTISVPVVYEIKNAGNIVDSLTIQVAEDSLFTKNVRLMSKATSAGITDTITFVLDRGKTYYHHGRIKNQQETTTWSVVWRFNTAFLPLSPCSPVYPANNSTVR